MSTDEAGAAVVLDTNVFVGAGFNTSSASRRILARVEAGELRLVWNEATRRETARILEQIPPLDWAPVAHLFQDADRYDGDLDPDTHQDVAGAMDRVFLALAEAAQVPLVTSDRDLLDVRERARVPVLTPGEYLRGLEGASRRDFPDEGPG